MCPSTRQSAGFVAVVGVLMLLSSPAAAENWAKTLRHRHGVVGPAMNLNVLGGIRIVDESQIGAPPDPQAEFGLDLDYTGEEWPWGLALCATVYYSRDDESGESEFGRWDVKSKTLEFQVGARKTWDVLEYLRPYVGAGGSLANMEVELESRNGSTTSEENGYGYWLGGGLYTTFFERLNIGVDARWSKVVLDFDGRHVDGGGWHIGGLIGYHWQEW